MGSLLPIIDWSNSGNLGIRVSLAARSVALCMLARSVKVQTLLLEALAPTTASAARSRYLLCFLGSFRSSNVMKTGCLSDSLCRGEIRNSVHNAQTEI